MSKGLVVFFGKEQEEGSLDPIDFGFKRPVYIDLFRFIKSEGYDVHICRGYNNFLGGNRYKVNWEMNSSGEFEYVEKVVSPEKVLDRSGNRFFPDSRSINVLNSLDFKVYTNNKWLCYLDYLEFFPKSFLINQPEVLQKYFRLLSNHTSKIVLKPVGGMKGKDIAFFGTDELELAEDFIRMHSGTFLMQEFVDTQKGVAELVDSYHDMRVVCLNKEIIWSHVRTPKQGDLKANVAAGGSIKELDPKDLPQSIKEITQRIIADFYTRYNNPLFSIDFGVSDGRPYIFEFNDHIGFPLPEMNSRHKFIEQLTRRLTDTI